ncbi:hypothetical protein [Brevundimonas subvibrioides]|nr:hypothetical protein [Brevundimonas subvibrioides]
MRIGRFPRIASAVMIGAVMALSPVLASAEGGGTYYDRTFVLAADQKCGLFRGPVAGALNAATLQSRGAALRGGVAEATLNATAARARYRAARVDCANPELTTVRDRVAHAFAGWQRIPRMDFIGDRATWTADRVRREDAAWRLVQPSVVGASPVRFGLSAMPNADSALSAVVSFVGRPRPYAARIVMRDPALAPRPWLTAAGSAVLPPESARKEIWSAGTAPAAPTLLAADRRQGEIWRFPQTGSDALAALDPREPFLVQFLFRDGSVATTTFEAGDFAAARAFVGLGTV